jgi:hypothetical protein
MWSTIWEGSRTGRSTSHCTSPLLGKAHPLHRRVSGVAGRLGLRGAAPAGKRAERLAAIVTRETMIGVAIPTVDWTASSPPTQAPADAS